MARRKKVEEHENHERWLVSYADFITLLFAFFVVMYSMSSVNEGKYRVLSDSMNAAFRSSARSLAPIQIGELVRSPKSEIPSIMDVPIPLSLAPVIVARNDNTVEIPTLYDKNSEAVIEATEQMEDVAIDVSEALQNLIEEEQVTIRKTPLWMEVEIKSNLLFASGSAVLSDEAKEILSNLAISFRDHPNRVNVEGFTDNLPIQSPIFPSNWELSSARAAAVVRLFESYGVTPERMSSVGYAEFRPISENSSPQGRADNRRVVVVLMANLGGEDADIPFPDLELFRQGIND